MLVCLPSACVLSLLSMLGLRCSPPVELMAPTDPLSLRTRPSPLPCFLRLPERLRLLLARSELPMLVDLRRLSLRGLLPRRTVLCHDKAKRAFKGSQQKGTRGRGKRGKVSTSLYLG